MEANRELVINQRLQTSLALIVVVIESAAAAAITG
jgi:hypothetical protein